MYKSSLLLACIAVLAAGVPAAAHHEAIFGPQSSLVLSGDGYLTSQVFTRTTGPADARTRETTTVMSAGVSPFRTPLSISVVVPFSVIASQGRARTGIENAIVAARYRVDLPGLERAWGGADSYVLGVGGIEVPTGTVDRPFGEGAPAVVSAGLFSFERGAWSFIGYGFVHRYGVYDGVRDGGHAFFGGGVAWTPLDREDEGRLFSLQLGVSRDTTFRDEIDGVAQETGGHTVTFHPTVMTAVGRRLLLFAVTSVTAGENWRDPDAHERLRVGTGVIVKLGR